MTVKVYGLIIRLVHLSMNSNAVHHAQMQEVNTPNKNFGQMYIFPPDTPELKRSLITVKLLSKSNYC